MTYYIGFDIGGTSIKYGLVDEQGEIIEKGLFPSTPDDGELLLKNMASQVATYQAKYPIERIGISVPGIVRKDGYMVTAGAIKPFYKVNLKEKCEAAFHLPVVLENDANCAAIAEQWLGNAQGIENYIVVVLGTAVGCGIIINGKVYQGAHGAAGEIGWSMQGPLDYTHDLEDDSWNFTSGVILGLYNRYYQATGQKISDARLILDLVRQGDVLATKVVDQYYEDVAKGLLNLICVFDPEVLLLGGGISANQEFLDKLTDRIEKIKRHHRSMNQLKNDTIADIKPCFLRNDAGLIGAVYQAKQMK
ncbi:ROK family protein [Lactococcus carnosus]|uniref:ROK family protein n=1 Tax=Pseudolactococcus carnosus TaxID=2749961 RepID=UPI001FB98779|nr:ROK family protein [Lactococcus carnosus]MCJ1970420.1 ROK family protein [Lactococcus carnosus]